MTPEEIIGPHENPPHDSPMEWCTACRCYADGVVDRLAAALAASEQRGSHVKCMTEYQAATHDYYEAARERDDLQAQLQASERRVRELRVRERRFLVRFLWDKDPCASAYLHECGYESWQQLADEKAKDDAALASPGSPQEK